MTVDTDDTVRGLMDAAELGLSHPMTQQAMEREEPGLVMQAQGNGLLMALIQGQAVGINNAARAFDGLGWLNVAQAVVLIMILWRVW